MKNNKEQDVAVLYFSYYFALQILQQYQNQLADGCRSNAARFLGVHQTNMMTAGTAMEGFVNLNISQRNADTSQPVCHTV